MSTTNIKSALNKKRVFKCPDCHMKYDKLVLLIEHVEDFHKNLIPKTNTTKQYVFNRKYKKTRGSCVMDKKETKWDESKGKYERYCSEKCREDARKKFQENAKRKLGTDNPASTPEHQLKTIAGRSYSGEYTFEDGGKVGYSSSYEKHFLEFIDTEMNMKSSEVEQCTIVFYYYLEGVKKFHIPDFFLPGYNVLIQNKDGGDNPNNNSYVQGIGRIRQKLADAAIVADGNYNYVKIVNKEYDNFINIIKVLDDRRLSSNTNDDNDVIICIPE